jgi:hypothetical protein
MGWEGKEAFRFLTDKLMIPDSYEPYTFEYDVFDFDESFFAPASLNFGLAPPVNSISMTSAKRSVENEQRITQAGSRVRQFFQDIKAVASRYCEKHLAVICVSPFRLLAVL